MERNKKLYAILVALVGITATVDTITANYFYEVYNADAVLRGIIEFPRELPGIVQMLMIGFLAFMGNTKKAMISQILSGIGLLVLGFVTPPFAVMCIFLFIYSLGAHLYMPLHDAIAVEMADEGKSGTYLGKMHSIKLASTMIMSIIVYFGFKVGVLNFNSPILAFILFGTVAIVSGIGFWILSNREEVKALEQKYIQEHDGQLKFKMVFRKEYGFYYALATLNGVQKQIMLVFGPWVLIDLLEVQTDTIIFLSIIALGLGVYAIKWIGILLDKIGIRKMMFADAFTFIFVYACYGLLCGAIINGNISANLATILAGSMLILDRISMRFGIVRTVYLKNIAVEGDNIADTISLGISMDHIVAITCAMLSGLIWKFIGPQYVFYLTALLSCVNVVIAKKVKINE